MKEEGHPHTARGRCAGRRGHTFPRKAPGLFWIHSQSLVMPGELRRHTRKQWERQSLPDWRRPW